MGSSRVQLETVWHEVARRTMMRESKNEIAQAMCMRREQIDMIMRNTGFKNILDQLRDRTYRTVDRRLADDAVDIHEAIQDLQEASLDKLEKVLLESPNENLQVKVAMDLLDRGGNKSRETRQPTTVININQIEADVLARALANEREARARLESIDVKTLAPKAEEVRHPVAEQYHGNRDTQPTE